MYVYGEKIDSCTSISDLLATIKRSLLDMSRYADSTDVCKKNIGLFISYDLGSDALDVLEKRLSMMEQENHKTTAKRTRR